MANFCKNCGKKILSGSQCDTCSPNEQKETFYQPTAQTSPTNTPTHVATNTGEMYFNISIYRLIFLSIFTLGIYDIYWFYRNWKYIAQTTGRKLSPVGRGIFSIFFCHELFKNIGQKAEQSGHNKHYTYGLLSATYIIATILSNATSRADTTQYDSSEIFYVNIFIIGLTIISVIPLYLIQKQVNFINQKNNYNIDNKFTGGEVVVTLIGVVLFIIFALNISNY
jgi:hypothetical protein